MLVSKVQKLSMLKCDKCGAEGPAVLDDGPRTTRARWREQVEYMGKDNVPGRGGRWKCEPCKYGPSPLLVAGLARRGGG